MTGWEHADLSRMGEAAAQALRRQDHRTARPLFEKLAVARPDDISVWYGLALACRGLGDDAAQLAALDRVLAADPRHIPALLMKADQFARSGDGRAAHTFYKTVVARAASAQALPPDLRAEVARAERECARYAREYERHLLNALEHAGFDPRSSSPRFTQSLDLLLGKKQIYLQSPTSFYFPELPQRQFYERHEFAWLPAFEAHTDVIAGELLEVLGDDAAFRPYMLAQPNRPPGVFADLADSVDWAAFFLIEGGSLVETAAARCPRTMAALAGVPLTDAPGRTPSVLFSRLRPGVRIPPHTGQINARLICHLPLIVPPGCGLRVGNEVRHWARGETLIFDDSIEHEAWNHSDTTRVVLLFEIWRPELSEEERILVAAALAAVGSFNEA